MPHSKDPQPRHDGYEFRRWIAAGLLGAVAAFNAGCTTEPRPSVDNTSQTGSPSPSAGETPKAPEFESGATGQYAPDALAALAALADNPEALVNVFRITGTTPEEIAENTQKALIGFLMSGTTETDLSKYRVNGDVSGSAGADFINQVGDSYEASACEGMNGEPCNFKADVKNLHDIVLSTHSLNHGSNPESTLAPDFMLGADIVSDVKVVDGSMKSGRVSIQYDTRSSNNYKGSAAEKIAIELLEGDAAAKYVSVQNWSGHRRITQEYEKSGDHWIIASSGAMERVTD